MTTHPSIVLSAGDIAKRIGHDRARVRYVLLRDGFRPVCRVGAIRAFAEDVVDPVRRACEQIERERQAVGLAAI